MRIYVHNFKTAFNKREDKISSLTTDFYYVTQLDQAFFAIAGNKAI
jgi:hypothetical protein